MLRIASLLFCLTLLACGNLETMEETDDQGYRTEYTVDPETKEKQGESREYAPSGALLVEENYAAGALNGTRKVYNIDGSIATQENYVAGELEGPYSSYDSLGRLSMAGEFDGGVMAGKWHGYYEDGALKEEVTFAENAEQGPFREWYPDGTPKASGSYLDGDQEHGTLHLYAETGELERVMNCDRGRCQTFWTPDSTGVAPEVVDMVLPTTD